MCVCSSSSSTCWWHKCALQGSPLFGQVGADLLNHRCSSRQAKMCKAGTSSLARSPHCLCECRCWDNNTTKQTNINGGCKVYSNKICSIHTPTHTRPSLEISIPFKRKQSCQLNLQTTLSLQVDAINAISSFEKSKLYKLTTFCELQNPKTCTYICCDERPSRACSSPPRMQTNIYTLTHRTNTCTHAHIIDIQCTFLECLEN